MPKGTQLNTRIDDELAARLDQLATATGRPKARLVQEALARYMDEQSWQVATFQVDEQSWQVAAIQEALDDYHSGQAELVPHEDVMQRLEAKIRVRLP